MPVEPVAFHPKRVITSGVAVIVAATLLALPPAASAGRATRPPPTTTTQVGAVTDPAVGSRQSKPAAVHNSSGEGGEMARLLAFVLVLLIVLVLLPAKLAQLAAGRGKGRRQRRRLLHAVGVAPSQTASRERKSRPNGP